MDVVSPPRPFRATVYLPGHDEQGKGVVVAKVSATSQERLDRVLQPWRDEGYRIRAYEVLSLFDDDPEDPDADLPE